jgi:hypothetical protein
MKNVERFSSHIKKIFIVRNLRTHPNEKGRLFPVPRGTVAIGGGCESLRSLTTPSSQLAVPSPPATYLKAC